LQDDNVRGDAENNEYASDTSQKDEYNRSKNVHWRHKPSFDSKRGAPLTRAALRTMM